MSVAFDREASLNAHMEISAMMKEDPTCDEEIARQHHVTGLKKKNDFKRLIAYNEAYRVIVKWLNFVFKKDWLKQQGRYPITG